jgi:nanoRNase/pAp phosphatase (c-di-AMP/oligoRNAs hydrolase)
MTRTLRRSGTKRSERLLAAIEPYERVAIVMHDNPDPDAIATGWAAKFLLDQRSDKPTRLIAGGDIVRAENRHMVRLLRPPLELLDDVQLEAGTAVILVDCGLDATNHLFSDAPCVPRAVIDHHQPAEKSGFRSPSARSGWQNGRTPRTLLDIRADVAASATIITTYLREQNLEPNSDLATALLYAIHSETRGGETYYSRLDRIVLPWLTRRADPSLLAEIQSAPLAPAYFVDLVLALQTTFIYDDAAFCMLPQAASPEIVGEVADLLVRREGVHRVVCAAVCHESVLLSVRTDQAGGDATQLLLDTIRGIGRGGGHTHRAGGKLSESTTGSRVPEELQEELRARWLRACGVRRVRGTRLLPKRAIVQNL